MTTELLDIQPQELKFIFELKKQSSCSVRLVNKTNQHVAFKVKTTSPKKYCVRPNTGVVKPKEICDFTVTMQAQRVFPPDMICKDKFLLQCAVVPEGMGEEDITSATFAKDGKYVEEKKLRVILVSPPNSPILSPVNGTPKQVQVYDVPILEEQQPNYNGKFSPHQTVIEDMRATRMDAAEDLKPVKDEIAEDLKPVKHETTENLKPVKRETAEDLKPVKHETADELILSKDFELDLNGHVVSKTVKDVEELNVVKDFEEQKPPTAVDSKITRDGDEEKLVKDIEEVKLKLKEFEYKLNEAERTISKLTEEKRRNTHDRENLQQELGLMRSKRSGQKAQAGFPLLFVCMVALVSVWLGYLMHKQ
ncbi:vesicle-associated protein 2-2 [Apium graveolens]|uniref:vesicle-associated protein 2-2 n=1 Tax=Apium graveolens TaxID=4045 RepID=UPI003D790039